MKTKPLPVILLALCFAFVLSYPYDQPPAAKKQTAESRFDKAAQAICKGAEYEVSGITLTCSAERGFTQKVAIK